MIEKMKEIKYTILYCAFVRIFVIPVPFYHGSGFGSARQKVTVPTVPELKLATYR